MGTLDLVKQICSTTERETIKRFLADFNPQKVTEGAAVVDGGCIVEVVDLLYALLFLVQAGEAVVVPSLQLGFELIDGVILAFWRGLAQNIQVESVENVLVSCLEALIVCMCYIGSSSKEDIVEELYCVNPSLPLISILSKIIRDYARLSDTKVLAVELLAMLPHSKESADIQQCCLLHKEAIKSLPDKALSIIFSDLARRAPQVVSEFVCSFKKVFYFAEKSPELSQLFPILIGSVGQGGLASNSLIKALAVLCKLRRTTTELTLEEVLKVILESGALPEVHPKIFGDLLLQLFLRYGYFSFSTTEKIGAAYETVLLQEHQSSRKGAYKMLYFMTAVVLGGAKRSEDEAEIIHIEKHIFSIYRRFRNCELILKLVLRYVSKQLGLMLLRSRPFNGEIFSVIFRIFQDPKCGKMLYPIFLQIIDAREHWGFSDNEDWETLRTLSTRAVATETLEGQDTPMTEHTYKRLTVVLEESREFINISLKDLVSLEKCTRFCNSLGQQKCRYWKIKMAGQFLQLLSFEQLRFIAFLKDNFGVMRCICEVEAFSDVLLLEAKDKSDRIDFLIDFFSSCAELTFAPGGECLKLESCNFDCLIESASKPQLCKILENSTMEISAALLMARMDGPSAPFEAIMADNRELAKKVLGFELLGTVIHRLIHSRESFAPKARHFIDSLCRKAELGTDDGRDYLQIAFSQSIGLQERLVAAYFVEGRVWQDSECTPKWMEICDNERHSFEDSAVVGYALRLGARQQNIKAWKSRIGTCTFFQGVVLDSMNNVKLNEESAQWMFTNKLAIGCAGLHPEAFRKAARIVVRDLCRKVLRNQVKDFEADSDSFKVLQWSLNL